MRALAPPGQRQRQARPRLRRAFQALSPPARPKPRQRKTGASRSKHRPPPAAAPRLAAANACRQSRRRKTDYVLYSLVFLRHAGLRRNAAHCFSCCRGAARQTRFDAPPPWPQRKNPSPRCRARIGPGRRKGRLLPAGGSSAPQARRHRPPVKADR